MIHPTPRLRFAPSPTGPLHLGGARTAMYNWAAARAMGGAFLLRIEDTDQARSTAASLEIILAGLEWLGIDWDEGPGKGGAFGPYFQMQRLPMYAEACRRLLASGRAYLCYCTPEEIEAGRAELEAQKAGFVGYNRRCRSLTDTQRAEFERQGRKPNVRFRMPERSMVVHDLVKGDVEVHTKELDDWVMMRADGVPLYNFACVVDDIGMKITHVVRGDEHFQNGHKQRLLFEALGHECPVYAHIPLILNKEGKKLSKRDPGVLSALEYRDRGFAPDAVFNYIALLGWSFSGERDVFSRDEMVARFKIEDIGKSGSRFDEEKLLWMCGEYMRALSPAECLRRVRPWLDTVVPGPAWQTHASWLANVVACYQERVALFADYAPRIGWLFADPVPDDAAKKNLGKDPASGAWLAAWADALEASDLPPSFPAERAGADDDVRLPSKKDAPAPACAFATPARIEADCRAFVERLGVKFGSFVHPVRAALTGTDKGPGLFDVVFLLGKETCVRRLRAAAGGARA